MEKVAKQHKYNSFKTLWIWQVRTGKTAKCAKKKVFKTSGVNKAFSLLQLFHLLLGQEGKASPNQSNRKSSGSVKASVRGSLCGQKLLYYTVLYCSQLKTIQYRYGPGSLILKLSANKMSLEG